MAIEDRKKEIAYENFEKELLEVLKKDKEHSIPFNKLFAFKSRRFDCMLAAADVRLDKKTGELVMVGAFKSGTPIVDYSKGFPEFKTDVEIPLRECYDDLKLSSGMEESLLDKTRKAVVDKYVTGYVRSFENRGMAAGGKLSFDDFGLDELKIDRSRVVEIESVCDSLYVIRSDSFTPSYDTQISRFHLTEVQELGGHLQKIEEKYRQAAEVFHQRKKELEPLSSSLSQRDTDEHNRDALITMYNKSFPLTICNSIAKNLVGSDIFDLNKHSLVEISDLVAGYKPSKTQKAKVRKGPSM